MTQFDDDLVLAHSGRKLMKWYQHIFGEWDERAAYNKRGHDREQQKSKTDDKDSPRSDYDKRGGKTRESVSKLTDAQLDKLIARIKKEQELQKLIAPEPGFTKRLFTKFQDSLINEVGNTAAKQLTSSMQKRINGYIDDRKKKKEQEKQEQEQKKSEAPKQQEQKKSEAPKQQEQKKSEAPKQQEQKKSEAPKQQEQKKTEAPKQQEPKKSEAPKPKLSQQTSYKAVSIIDKNVNGRTIMIKDDQFYSTNNGRFVNQKTALSALEKEYAGMSIW